MKNLIFKYAGMALLLASLGVSAQSAVESAMIEPFSAGTKEVYEHETVYLNGTMTRYTLNKKEKRVGLFARFLKREFDSCSTESKTEMAICVKSKKRGAILLGTGGTVTMGGIVALGAIAPPIGLGIVVAGLVPYAIGAIKLQKAQNHLQKAVWLHNRDVLMKGDH